MDRRTALKVGGMAAFGIGFGGCATSRNRVGTAPRPPVLRRAANLPPVDISWGRVIRTTVGLRPHRPKGFVVRGDRLDGKLLVHNYGHGGTGHSLGWGTGVMAAEIALQQEARQAAVIGCGTVGLTAARQLQRRGFDVTIYAATLPPDTTSNMALAGFTPTSGLISGERTPEFDAQFRRAAAISYEELQLLMGLRYGVDWVDNYTPSETPEPPPPNPNLPETGLLPASLRTEREVLGPGEHPFATKYAFRTAGIRIEPSIYLETLMRDVLLFGGRIVVRKFATPRDLVTLAEPVIVNCSGLGARTLFGDDTMMPVKGQLTVLLPQREINYRTGGSASGRNEPSAPGMLALHMMPRTDGIVLGGTSERGVSTLEPNEEARKAVVDGHIELFNSMRRGGAGPRRT